MPLLLPGLTDVGRASTDLQKAFELGVPIAVVALTSPAGVHADPTRLRELPLGVLGRTPRGGRDDRNRQVPALELDAEQKARWREFRHVLAEALRERRYRQGRAAWSMATAAEREHEQLERLADPAVRAMTEQERAEWAQRHQQPDRELAGVYSRHADGPAGTVSVTVEPCQQRWGLHARGTTSDGRVVEALVSCADQAIAARLADAVAEKGADAVGRLQSFAVRAAERAAAVRGQVRRVRTPGLTPADRLIISWGTGTRACNSLTNTTSHQKVSPLVRAVMPLPPGMRQWSGLQSQPQTAGRTAVKYVNANGRRQLSRINRDRLPC